MGETPKLMLDGTLSNLPPVARLQVTKQRPVVTNAYLATSASIKAGIHRYETMLILRPDMLDQDRDRQLAKFEAFLANEGAEDIDCAVKGRQTMSYPIKDHRDGVYVLFQYMASGLVAKAVHKKLANPDAETQGNIIRWV